MMPYTWESDLWTVQVDLSMALWLLLYGAGGAEGAVDSLSSTIHEMFSASWSFYGSFLNINTARNAYDVISCTCLLW